jgi:hypothetical protein
MKFKFRKKDKDIKEKDQSTPDVDKGKKTSGIRKMFNGKNASGDNFPDYMDQLEEDESGTGGLDNTPGDMNDFSDKKFQENLDEASPIRHRKKHEKEGGEPDASEASETVSEGTRSSSKKKGRIRAALDKINSPLEYMGAIFLFILGAVFIINIILPDASFSPSENRIYQQFPKLSLTTYMQGRFESKLDNYASDQFLLRGPLIKLKTSSDLAVGKLKSNGVIKCHDNYLMEDITVPDKQQLSETKRLLRLFKRQYENINMYFLLAPNAANIYHEKLPATVETADQNTYMDSFFKSMTKYGIIPIDVRATFRQKKNSTQLYYRTDHHWTTEGAKLAYDVAHQKMDLTSNVKYKKYVVSNSFKGTLYSKSGFTNGRDDSISIYLPTSKDYRNSVIYYSDTKEKTTNFYQLDNLKKKDAYSVFGGSNHPYYTITTPNKSKRNLLIIKDSYANSMIPFFTQDFRKIVVVDPRYYFGKLSDMIKSNDITDILFLYNGNSLFSDTSLSMMLS